MSVVEVLGTRGASIDARRLNMLDGTPILDIKPLIEGPPYNACCVDGTRVADACPGGVRDRGRRFRQMLG
jgi:tRNA (Thr-GGU) A37 N-methylase